MAADPGTVSTCSRNIDVHASEPSPGGAGGDLLYDVTQPPISRAVTVVTPLLVLGKVLKKYVPPADELDDRTQ